MAAAISTGASNLKTQRPEVKTSQWKRVSALVAFVALAVFIVAVSGHPHIPAPITSMVSVGALGIGVGAFLRYLIPEKVLGKHKKAH